jgi:hypothetical protein
LLGSWPTGLPDNEATNAAAKVVTLHRTSFLIELSAVMFTPYFITLFYHHGKMNGLNNQCNKLHMVKPSMQTWHSYFSAARKKELTCA